MSEEQVPWADWLEAFGEAARHPLGIEYVGDPVMDYRDETKFFDPRGTPPDEAILAQVRRHLARVTGTLEVEIIVPQPPVGYCVEYSGYPCVALCGPSLPADGRDLIDYLEGHEAIIGMVDDAMKADYLGGEDDLDDWEGMKLNIFPVARSLAYRPDGLILTILVDYDANS